MGFTTIEKVRARAGVRGKYERNPVKLFGTADGTNKDFYLPTNYIIDSDGDESVTTSDLVVYDDGVSVAITSIDVSSGKVVLTAAPAASSDMTVSYTHSNIKDSEISAYITQVEDFVKKECRTIDTETTYTQYWDGDGETVTFYFRYIPVTEVTEVDIGGSTSYTENTDYWLYPERDNATYIKFLGAPSTDNQNIKITYKYGETNYVINKLVTAMVARDIVVNRMSSENIGKVAYSGRNNEMKYYTEGTHVSMKRALEDEISDLMSKVPGRMRWNVV